MRDNHTRPTQPDSHERRDLPGPLLKRLAATAIVLATASAAHAHSAEGGLVLLLPTGYYLTGAAVAVAATFLLLAALPDRASRRLATMRLNIATVPDVPHAVTSSLSFLFLALLLVAGIFGTRDPVENPLPLTIWTVWWLCLTVAQCVTGPLWPHLNPWTGPFAVLRRLSAIEVGKTPLARLPERAGYRIAILQFAAFAWFELVDLAPADPDRLAAAVITYWLLNFGGMLVFGEKEWMGRAEPFSIFFGLIGRLSPFDRRPDGADATRIALVWPGYSLIRQPALPLSGVLFILLALSNSSFDGLSRTFLWLEAIRINPLEFPGRSAVEMSGTIGMVGTFLILSAVFLIAVAIGCRMAGQGDIWKEAAGRLVYSIAPIALAFQAAHHLTSLLVEGQNVLIAYSDPFSLGWNLFGTAGWHTTTSFLNTMDGVSMIFNAETALIATGHVVGIVMAHLIATQLFADPRKAVISQIPLAALMVFYTAFGLWLLSTPRV